MLVRQLAAESFGAFCLVAVGGFALVGLSDQLAPVGVPIVFGVVIGLLVYTLARTSGAHLNPAITIALAVTRRHPWRLAPPYIVAQFVGGAAGALLVRVVASDPLALLTQPAPGLSSLNAVAIEALATGLLAFVVAYAADAKTPAGDVPAAPIGFAILLGALFAGPFTGGSMNPARSIGPAWVAGDPLGMWIYLVGPITGAVTGALLHDWVARRRSRAGDTAKVDDSSTRAQGELV